MKLNRLKMISSNSFSKSSPLWKSRDNNDWRLQQWKNRRRISESIPFQIPGSDFPRSVFRSCTRQKDFTRVFMQSERLYVINTAEGKWTEREVEEEKTGIMRQQHNSPWLFSTRLIWKHSRIYLQLSCSMIRPLSPGQISIDVPSSYTNPHQALSEKSIFWSCASRAYI